MSNPTPPTPSEPAFAASGALLAAALGGLLLFVPPACSSSNVEGGDLDAGIVLDAGSTVDLDAGEIADAAATDAGEVADASSDAADDDAGEAGPVDAGADSGCADAGIGITKSVVDPTMTLEKFTMLCEAQGGTLEIHPHCGGANTCKGFSYDTTTQTYTEHSCVGLNTCTGYSCVVPC